MVSDLFDLGTRSTDRRQLFAQWTSWRLRSQSPTLLFLPHANLSVVSSLWFSAVRLPVMEIQIFTYARKSHPRVRDVTRVHKYTNIQLDGFPSYTRTLRPPHSAHPLPILENMSDDLAIILPEHRCWLYKQAV